MSADQGCQCTKLWPPWWDSWGWYGPGALVLAKCLGYLDPAPVQIIKVEAERKRCLSGAPLTCRVPKASPPTLFGGVLGPGFLYASCF